MIDVTLSVNDMKKQIESKYSARVDEIKHKFGELYIKVSKDPNSDLDNLYRELEIEGELLHEETDHHRYFVLKR